ncbi:hypothetical protein [Nocardia sp. NPDC057668]|uniref:hypothetical protein n=1 Tax=Nocardia sp. NPDC057668 TaxID=3346202 RepID=UPI00366FC0E2
MKVAALINQLPGEVYRPETSPVLQQAAVEAFFADVRAMIEFLGIRPAKSGDFSAVDLVPGWTRSTDAARDARLNRYWLIASRHLMHFSKKRTRSDEGPAENIPVEREDLEKIADGVLDLWDEYATAANDGLCPARKDLLRF